MITVPIAGFSGVSYFAFIMFLVVVTAATTSFYQIGVFAAASRFPHKYLQGIMRYAFVTVNYIIRFPKFNNVDFSDVQRPR
jgi:hypothetical protein